MAGKSNFSLLPPKWLSIVQSAVLAEKEVRRAPMYAAVLCRKSLEECIRWMYAHDSSLVLPYDDSLNALMHGQSFKELIAPNFFSQLHLIRKLGNDAVHTGKRISSVEALHALKLLHGFIFWLVNVYNNERIEKPVFDETLIPEGTEAEKTKNELRKLEEEYAVSREKLKKLEEELEKTKEIKENNLSKTPPPIDPNEELTRSVYINSLLREAGWDPYGPNVVEFPVKGMPSQNGNDGDGFVDYVLWGNDGKPLAVVEAKRTRRDARVGQNQAKLYADCLEKEYNQRPLIFYSNGFETWFWDDTDYAPRKVFGFYTKDEMQLLINRRSSKQNLSRVPLSDIADRYYQHEAIRSVSEAFEQKKREALLVMATGTGKTRTAAALIELLSKAGWVKKVLFLADRTALVTQAKENLNIYLPHHPAIDLTKEKEDESSRIIFSTYQTLINQIDGEYDKDNRYYGVGHFDLIIFDEIHRSVYNKYQYIFKYFDGFRVGLTATPKAETNRDTYALFELEFKNPTYAYELEQAVNDGYLVPPKAISVPTKFHREGIKYKDLTDEEKEAYEKEFLDPVTGQLIEEIESTALNSWLFNIDTVDKVLSHLMTNGIKVEGGDKLGKTIIFARSHEHAKFIEERFNKSYPQYKGTFLRVIDYQEEYTIDLLKRFKIKDSEPQIAVSVDMLDTGIDVPEVLNLVFFKPVKSATKYWQMIGRGTRLCNNLFGEDQHKTHFLIFDLCENFEFFEAHPEGIKGANPKSISQRLFEVRLRLSHLLSLSNEEEINTYSKEIKDSLVKQCNDLNLDSFIVRQHLRIVEKYRDRNQWNSLTDLEIKEIFDNIAPLVIEIDEDEMAKRFDAIMYDMQIYTWQSDPQMIGLKDRIIGIAEKLTKKVSIPAVARKMDLLYKIQKDVYWENITVLTLEKLRINLRELIRFLEKETRKIVYTDYEDTFEDIKEHSLTFQVNDLEAYKKRVEHYIHEHENHLVIHKIKNNIPVTSKEVSELEKMLFEQGPLESKETFHKVYGDQPLSKFIRTIVGMEINAAKEAFASLISSQNFNSDQIRFIDIIIKFLSANGIIEPDRLFDPPFTEVNSKGVTGLFDNKVVKEIFAVIEVINSNIETA